MSRRHDEADWEERVARFTRSAKRVVNLGNVRRIEKPEPQPEPKPEPGKETPQP